MEKAIEVRDRNILALKSFVVSRVDLLTVTLSGYPGQPRRCCVDNIVVSFALRVPVEGLKGCGALEPRCGDMPLVRD